MLLEACSTPEAQIVAPVLALAGLRCASFTFPLFDGSVMGLFRAAEKEFFVNYAKGKGREYAD